jgi:hypothetical protein
VDQLSKQAMQMEEDGIYYAVGTGKQIERFEKMAI